MKNRADKIISEKLSSLESLPEGYVPNLEAKWSIINQTSQKKPIGYKFWISIAACLIVLAGSYFTWNFIRQTPAPEIVFEKALSNPVITPNEEKPVASTDDINLNKPVKSKRRSEKNNQAESIVPSPEIVNNEQTNTSTEIIAEQSTQPVQVSEQKKKSRYVEMDFNDKVELSSREEQKKNFAIDIKLRLDSKTDTESSLKENRSLRIKQNF